MKRVLWVLSCFSALSIYSETDNSCITKSIFKKIITPQRFNYETDIDSFLNLFRDNIDTLVAVPEGFQVTSDTIDQWIMDFRNHLKNNEPLGETSAAIVKDSYQVMVLKSSKGTVTGFINYWLYPTGLGNTVGYIEVLCVAKTRRNRGYGKRLMNQALDDLKKMHAVGVSLHTDAKNTTAQNLYKSLGFTILKKDYPFAGGLLMGYTYPLPGTACR